MTMTTKLFPHGRGICYEGDDPEGFCQEVQAAFGFDPSADRYWSTTCLNCDPQFHDPFGRTHWFWCPAEHLDAICGGSAFRGRHPCGS